MRHIAALLVLVGLLAGCSQPDGTDGTLEEMATSLERLASRHEAVVIMGFSTIGRMENNRSGWVELEAREYMDSATGERAEGIAISVSESGGRGSYSVSYVDYEDVDSLLDVVQYLADLKKSATSLDNMQADYVTHGGLELSVYNVDKRMRFAVSSSAIGGETVRFDRTRIRDFRNLVLQAQRKLNEIGG